MEPTVTQSLPLGWLYLPVAFALGAFHALEPGHGKSLASAYLVTGKHDWKDAVVLGGATTVSHTAVVVLLAMATLALKNYFSQGVLEQGLGFTGAAILIGMGAWVSFRAVQDIRHGHAHEHAHGHVHTAPTESAATSQHGFWAVALLGLSNGILPCPGALAALLVAVSLKQIGLGLVTVLTYSLGLATALSVLGIIVVEAGRRARRWLPSDQAMLWLPLASGLLVLGSGFWIISTK